MTVRNIHPGEHVGYGLAYTAENKRKIASLSIGFAEGLPRALSCGRGKVLIHGQEAPIVGRICMDQTMVDVTSIENVKLR
jgi:serine/alanine racemase